MFGGRSHHSQTQHPFNKQQDAEKPQSYQQMVTAVKKTEGTIYTQMTPRPNKKILLLDQHKEKHLFPLVRDREIGISTKYQKIVIQSYNDDDKQTSSTQLQRGMIQTLQDLYEVIEDNDNNM